VHAGHVAVAAVAADQHAAAAEGRLDGGEQVVAVDFDALPAQFARRHAAGLPQPAGGRAAGAAHDGGALAGVEAVAVAGDFQR